MKKLQQRSETQQVYKAVKMDLFRGHIPVETIHVKYYMMHSMYTPPPTYISFFIVYLSNTSLVSTILPTLLPLSPLNIKNEKQQQMIMKNSNATTIFFLTGSMRYLPLLYKNHKYWTEKLPWENITEIQEVIQAMLEVTNPWLDEANVVLKLSFSTP